MSSTFQTHRSILPLEQQRYWPLFKGVSEEGFVLYGGTAIALRLGHRISVDFDFFSHLPLDRSALFARYPFLNNADRLQDEGNTLTCSLPSLTGGPRLKVSFFGTIDFGQLQPPSWTDDRNVQVASLDDLLAQKLKVLLQRVETKDYVDIAELLHAGLSLVDGLAGAQALFHNTFSPAIAVATLSYFEGIDTKRFLPDRFATLQQATKHLITQDSLYLPARTIRSHYLTDDELSQRLPVQKQLQFINHF